MFVIYNTQQEARAAVEECNNSYVPFIKDNITKMWCEVEEFVEGWGFPLPLKEVWLPTGQYTLVTSPTRVIPE